MSTASNTHNPLSRYFSPSDVLCHLDATDYADALRSMVDHVTRSHDLADPGTIQSTLCPGAGEADCRVSKQVALPHARLPAIPGITMCIATSESGWTWRDGDPPEIQVIILILAPIDQPAPYHLALAAAARICKDGRTATRIAGTPSAEDIWSFFDRSGAIRDVVLACDIMRPVDAVLKDSDTLRTAIDSLVEHGTVELPVVDVDGDFVGVVSARALLKICLPDYILWVDDVESIVNFEPFADVLRHEGKTWLTEILTPECAIAQADVPAMQVARKIARHDTSCAYILHKRRLVGIVTLQHFLNKVMRE